jgi:hypothetical protein
MLGTGNMGPDIYTDHYTHNGKLSIYVVKGLYTFDPLVRNTNMNGKNDQNGNNKKETKEWM